MTKLSMRPERSVVGAVGSARERATCTSQAWRSTPTTWSTATSAPCTRIRCRPRTRTPGRVAAHRAGTAGARGRPGAHRGRRAGRQRRRGEARRAAVPGRGDVPGPRRVLGARRVAGGGPARCAWPSRSSTSRCRRWSRSPRRSRRRASRGPADAAPRRPGRGVGRLRARLRGRVRVRRPGALLPGDQRRARHDRRERTGVRPVEHPAPDETQEIIAHVLGLTNSEVTVQCLRMGGGFGGRRCSPTATRRSPRSAPGSPAARSRLRLPATRTSR